MGVKLQQACIFYPDIYGHIELMLSQFKRIYGLAECFSILQLMAFCLLYNQVAISMPWGCLQPNVKWLQ